MGNWRPGWTPARAARRTRSTRAWSRASSSDMWSVGMPAISSRYCGWYPLCWTFLPRSPTRWGWISNKVAGWAVSWEVAARQEQDQVSLLFSELPPREGHTYNPPLLFQSGSSGGNDNLVQAFVQFLEQESQPQANLQSRPTLLSMSGQVEASAANQPTPPAALPVQVPASAPERPDEGAGATTIGSNEFAPSRNSSSILKDILSDSWWF